MFLSMLLIPLIIVVLIVCALKFVINDRPPSNEGYFNYSNNVKTNNINIPLEILNERYAKGEISEEEYLKIRRNNSQM